MAENRQVRRQNIGGKRGWESTEQIAEYQWGKRQEIDRKKGRVLAGKRQEIDRKKGKILVGKEAQNQHLQCTPSSIFQNIQALPK